MSDIRCTNDKRCALLTVKYKSIGIRHYDCRMTSDLTFSFESIEREEFEGIKNKGMSVERNEALDHG